MNMNHIALAAALTLFATVPAVAAIHHPGAADWPVAATAPVSFPNQMIQPSTPAAMPAPCVAAPLAAANTDHLGYVVDGDKHYKRTRGT
jgi:hypothetical protein